MTRVSKVFPDKDPSLAVSKSILTLSDGIQPAFNPNRQIDRTWALLYSQGGSPHSFLDRILHGLCHKTHLIWISLRTLNRHINFDDGYWSWNVVVTSLKCWWLYILKSWSTLYLFSLHWPLASVLETCHQGLNSVTIIQQLSRQHQNLIIIQ